MGKLEIKFAEPPAPPPPAEPEITKEGEQQAAGAAAGHAAIDGYAPVAPAAGAPLPPPGNLIIVTDSNLVPFMTSTTAAVLVLEDPDFSECEAMRPVLAAAARQFPDVKIYVVEDAEGSGIAKIYPVTTYPTLLFRTPTGDLKRANGTPPSDLKRVNGTMPLQDLVSQLESPTATAKQ